MPQMPKLYDAHWNRSLSTYKAVILVNSLSWYLRLAVEKYLSRKGWGGSFRRFFALAGCVSYLPIEASCFPHPCLQACCLRLNIFHCFFIHFHHSLQSLLQFLISFSLQFNFFLQVTLCLFHSLNRHTPCDCVLLVCSQWSTPFSGLVLSYCQHLAKKGFNATLGRCIVHPYPNARAALMRWLGVPCILESVFLSFHLRPAGLLSW